MTALGLDFDTAQLATLTATGVCEALQLAPQTDGTYARQNGTKRLLLLPVGDILPWQKADQRLEIQYLAGAPLAVSWSADGQNAAAAHLGANLPHHKAQETLPADIWLTAESLGLWSLIVMHGETPTPQFTLAPPDWFPTPMAAPQGEA